MGRLQVELAGSTRAARRRAVGRRLQAEGGACFAARTWCRCAGNGRRYGRSPTGARSGVLLRRWSQGRAGAAAVGRAVPRTGHGRRCAHDSRWMVLTTRPRRRLTAGPPCGPSELDRYLPPRSRCSRERSASITLGDGRRRLPGTGRRADRHGRRFAGSRRRGRVQAEIGALSSRVGQIQRLGPADRRGAASRRRHRRRGRPAFTMGAWPACT